MDFPVVQMLRAAAPYTPLILRTKTKSLRKISEMIYSIDFELILTAPSTGALREPTERLIPQLFNSWGRNPLKPCFLYGRVLFFFFDSQGETLL